VSYSYFMRDTIELIALILLLVAGYHALDGRHSTWRGAVRSFLAWACFFGGIIALSFFPRLVVIALHVALLFGVYYALRWVWDWGRDLVFGPPLVPRPKRRQAVNMILDQLAFGVPLIDMVPTSDASDAGAHFDEETVAEARRLLKTYGFEVVLRSAFQQERRGTELPEDFETRAQANRDAVEHLCRKIAKKHHVRVGRMDRRFVAGALLAYEEGSVDRVLRGLDKPLGTKGRRRRAAKALAEDAKRSPWIDLLIGANLFPADRAERQAAVKEKRPVSTAAYAFGIVFPPAAYAMTGEGARGALLAFTSLALLGYSIFALLESRSVGWVYLAVWGLFQLLGMFSAHDAWRGRFQPRS